MADTGQDEYCALYLSGVDRPGAAGLVAAALGAVPDGHLVRSGGVEFEVLRNPGAGRAADFLGWPLKIEAEGPRAAAVDAVSRVLAAAWARGCRAVAACDFEDELPRLGGIGRSGA
ncbi:hypothetical protein [Streptomyces sp. NRRL B-24484]|uniref:hypothetical protein n=1 Tax=Streptomyces sp. NRRL B-24484 TaxID=1463833 RepID=UPI0004BEF02E|nr:hypothetical protein [Streptomyces sp. NRRL B-24484]